MPSEKKFEPAQRLPCRTTLAAQRQVCSAILDQVSLITSQLSVSSIDHVLGKQIADRQSFLGASQEQEPINAPFVRADEHFVPGGYSTDLPSTETGLWGLPARLSAQRVVDRLR
jgi:hypothetical protein